METYNKDLNQEPPKRFDDRSGRIGGGLILVVIGALFLAHQAGVDFPHWILSLPMFAVAIGLFVGARRSFVPGGWLIPVVIGGVFLLNDIFYDFDLRHYLWPSIIIGIGLFMIFRPRHRGKKFWGSGTVSADESFDAVSIFGGTKRNIISKDFKGGEITTAFGGTELNFMQGDITGTAQIDITQIFGGTKLIVPSNWNIKSEVVCVFGGIDDKRPIMKDLQESNKTLVLRGVCIFGGIDIRSY